VGVLNYSTETSQLLSFAHNRKASNDEHHESLNSADYILLIPAPPEIRVNSFLSPDKILNWLRLYEFLEACQVIFVTFTLEAS
jgi:hypothetical protein